VKSTAPTATAFSFVLLLAVASSAQADVGFESASRRAGSPGDRVELTIGCGFCFPPCVGEPGRRHAPGDSNGYCMLGNRGGPPASFPVWLTPLRHSLAPYVCDAGANRCEPGSSRPPHLPSLIYIGRAVPAAPGGDEAHEIPRYRLTFGVPEVRPGRYKYVLFCETCVDGPRGSLIDSATTAAGRLRVLTPIATASAGGDGGTLPWIAAGACAALLALGAAVLRRGRGARPQAGRAA
jgi:hypothetical protein